MNNSNTNSNTLLKFFIFMVTLIFIATLFAIRKIVMPFRELQYTLTFVSITLYAILYVLGNYRTMPKLVTNTLFLCVIILLTTYFVYADRPVDAIIHVLMKALFWGATLISFYAIGLKQQDAVRRSMFITAFIPILLVLFINAADYMKSIDDFALLTSAYYLLCLLPFVFLIKKPTYKTLCIVCIFIALLNSSKRTGFIALLAAMFVYMLVKNKMENKSIFAGLQTIFVFVVLYVILVYFIERYDFGILDKMDRISEDGGSGRIDIYKHTWEMFLDADFTKKVFGHGFNQVYFDSGLELSAHTDFLEVLYDYGMVGFVLYMNMYRILLKYAKNLYAKRSEYAPAFYSAIVIMVVLSATSHLMIFDTYFFYLCMFFGLVAGTYDREAEEELQWKELA